MDIIFHRKKLLKALALLYQIVPAKVQARPVLANILLKVVDGDVLELSSTDMEMGMKYRMPLIRCNEANTTLLPAFQLMAILKEADSDEIHLEKSGRTAVLSTRRAQYKLPSFAEDEFPEVPELEGESITLPKAGLSRLISEVGFAMNKEPNRFSHNSLLLCLRGNTLEGVATDQIRLAYSQQPLEQTFVKDERYIIPAKAVAVLQSLFTDDEEESILMIKGENQVTFKFKAGFLITRQVEGVFPPYREAYDKYADVPNIVMPVEMLMKAVRQIILLTCENARNIAVLLDEGQMVLKASTPLGEGQIELGIDYKGESVRLGINPFYVQDFLKELTAQGLEMVRIKMAGARRPVIMSPHDQYLYFMSPTSV